MFCGKCGCTHLGGGVYGPERCLRCGASEFGDVWVYDEKAVPTIEQIRKEWKEKHACKKYGTIKED